MGTNDADLMSGEVTKVNEYPEPSWSSSAPKEYLVFVEIDNPPDTLRTGLTAKVEIIINQRDNVLQVPVQAVHLHGDRYYCIVQDDNGDWFGTRVTIGPTNNESVVILSGLEEGMRVSLTPTRYLDRVDLPAAPAGQDEPTRGPGDGRQKGPSRPAGARGGR
jgi:multidrug efflux pump subunit AcrA (membrane-fusion protein)